MSENAKGEERFAHKVPPRLSGVCYETEFHICFEGRQLSRKLQHKAAQKKRKENTQSSLIQRFRDRCTDALFQLPNVGFLKKISNKLLTHSGRSVFPFLRF